MVLRPPVEATVESEHCYEAIVSWHLSSAVTDPTPIFPDAPFLK
jgi:hypothetical protein